ncbi:hypothetical protein [Photobacterium damselae]|uniref:hypothetical protein n=1 Tax=Photobacterium damselae TaxID=38293 RepID=UPI000D6659F3|nr:hypothetical protein [Photobacterium damselae]AWK84496.1 hypothetical protein BST98_20905 [Photobacterium damselae]
MFGEFTPLMKPGLLQRRLHNGKARLDPDFGLEKLCPRCNEYWPQDTLFWRICSSSSDGLQGWCSACESEHRRLRRAAA